MLMLRSLAIGLMLTMLKGRIELLDAGMLPAGRQVEARKLVLLR